MHIPTPDEIRARRETLGLKQTELARRSGVSQSMIARIEAGNVDPRVSTLGRIISVLNSAARKSTTAADVMHTPVLSVMPDLPIADVMEIMDKNSISQLPVIENGIPVGCVSESAIVNTIEEQRLHKNDNYYARDFMESGFPTVPPDTAIETVVSLLSHHHAVLVLAAGRVQGVITKHDLISLIVRS
jgi:predicted transcriptional regulator